MSLRVRKSIKIGPVTSRITPRSGSVTIGGRRVRATAGRRGIGVGVTLLPGVSWFRRLRREETDE